MNPLLKAMTEAARVAGEGLMLDFSRVRADLGVTSKIGPDFVSEADLRAEATIKSVLTAHAPDYAFHGEEGGRVGGEEFRSHLARRSPGWHDQLSVGRAAFRHLHRTCARRRGARGRDQYAGVRRDALGGKGRRRVISMDVPFVSPPSRG